MTASVNSLKDTDPTTTAHGKDMGLSEEEYGRAVAVLGRIPNKVELGCFSAMWSEHCSYKSSRVHLRKLPTTGQNVVIGPGENAGVVDIGGGLCVAFKVESHNHPSFIEPYQGAATGVGGILRDVFTMGARPVAAMNLLRFGQAAHKKTPGLLSGVVRGIGGYGNCFGVPTVYSNSDFDTAYDGNILVNAFALGVLKRDAIFLGRAEGTGNPVLYAGAKTGRDGIHGATMASDSFSEGEAQERPTVQVGDPFKEKLLLEACLECMRTDCLVGIQDMGAAGLTSSSFEMASRAGSGVFIDLDQVPARETHMTAYELMLSESQERMLLVAKRGREPEVQAIFARWGLDCTVIGRVSDDGFVRLQKGGVEVAVMPARQLADDAPKYDRPFVLPSARAADSDVSTRAVGLGALLERVLLSPTFASKWWIYRQFDREVGAGTLLDGTRAPAALVRLPAQDGTGAMTERGVAMALVCDGRVCEADPREGARRAVAEGVLRTAAVGARAVGASDCLNYGNPQKPEIMGQIVAGIEGISEACVALGVPVVSGNVSLYNQTDDRAVLPTPTVGVVGVVDDVRQVSPPERVQEGDALVLLGRMATTLSGSFAVSAVLGRPALGVDAWPLQDVANVAATTSAAVRSRLAKCAWPVAAGGVAVAAAHIATTNDRGVYVDVPAGEDAFAMLLGEDAVAMLWVVASSRLAELAAACGDVPFAVIGAVGGKRVVLGGVELDLADYQARSGAVLPAVVAGKWQS